MKYFEHAEVEQGSDDWLALRLTRVTASQTPILFDLSPYTTRLGLFEEKSYGIIESPSGAKQMLYDRGHAAERAGREWIEEHMGLKFAPAVLLSTAHTDLMASLDGFSEKDRLIFEAKYVGRDRLSEIKSGKIPPNHECQIQTQLLVSGAEKCIYFATDSSGDSAIVDVIPNLAYYEEIAEAARKFMDCVRSGTAPEPSERDYFTPEGDLSEFKRLRELKLTMDAATEDFESQKQKLIEQYVQRRVRAGGVTIVRSIRKGNVQYQKIPMLKGVDLEKFRSKQVESVTVRLEKE